MRLIEVTEQDGRFCAQLLNILKEGRWDLSGADAEAFVSTKKWVQSIAMQMAEQLKSKSVNANSSSTSGFKVQQIGSLPITPIKAGSKKKK